MFEYDFESKFLLLRLQREKFIVKTPFCFLKKKFLLKRVTDVSVPS